MDNLNSFSRVLLRIYALAHTHSVSDFQDAALEVLKEILPFDSSMWGSATMSIKGIDIHTLHLLNTSKQMIEEYEKVKHLDHFAQDVVSKEQNTIRFSACDAQTSKFYDFLIKFQHHHGLISQSINPQTQFAQWLSLFRSDPSHKPSCKEVALFEKLFAHLSQALTINRKVHLEQLLGSESRDKWSVAISDFKGFLYHTEQDFREILHQDFPITNADFLPQELVDGFTNSIYQLTLPNSVILAVVETDLIFLKIRNKVAADHLSQKEFVIAKMLASGLSLKEIAKKIDRSPDTVRTHGKAIFKKLGTNKATQISQMLLERE